MDLFKFWKQDLPAGLVVFLVALPLCLGIGLASTSVEDINGLPNVLTGIISGIIGGIIVAVFSNSRLGVSGPAAGLITIVIAAIQELGSFQAFLLALLLSGIIQIVLGLIRFGMIATYVPTAVIKGMLAAIGITLILKEFPHLLGYDKDFFGDESFWQFDGHNTFSELFYALNAFELGAVIIGILSIFILILFDTKVLKTKKWTTYIPGALVVVLTGIIVNMLFNSQLKLGGQHLVQLPVITRADQFWAIFNSPDFKLILSPKIWTVALTIALVGSLETLLSVEATDKLDPKKYKTDPNKELRAQGIGNLVSGLIGGLPVTQVIVRSSANIAANGQSKFAAIIHGLFLLLSLLFLGPVLNHVPLAALAAVLILVGYKLAKWSLFVEMYQKGLSQFIPFIATIASILLTDLLKGIGIGILIAIFYVLKRNYQNHFTLIESADSIELILSEEVTFLNKGGILKVLYASKGKRVTVDGSRTKSIDQDVLEALHEYKLSAELELSQRIEFINI
ncbi:MAG: SulP family inorganic anion transporter [Flavobacteriales bacterium]